MAAKPVSVNTLPRAALLFELTCRNETAAIPAETHHGSGPTFD
jgi:hypothetical protein